MTVPALPQIDCEQHHTTLFACDLPAAIDFYTNKLGFWLAFTWGEPPTIIALSRRGR